VSSLMACTKYKKEGGKGSRIQSRGGFDGRNDLTGAQDK